MVLSGLVHGLPCRHELEIALGGRSICHRLDCFRSTLPNEGTSGCGEPRGTSRALFGTRAAISLPVVTLRQVGAISPGDGSRGDLVWPSGEIFLRPTIAVACFAGLTLLASGTEEFPFLAASAHPWGLVAVWVSATKRLRNMQF